MSVTSHTISFPASSARDFGGGGVLLGTARQGNAPDISYHVQAFPSHQKFTLSAAVATFEPATNAANNLREVSGESLTREPGISCVMDSHRLYINNRTVVSSATRCNRREYLNSVHVPDTLVPLARRSGLTAVASAYDAGLSAPVLA